MKTFYVRKIFRYDPTFGGKYSKYDGYNLITTNRLEVGISEKGVVELKNVDSPLISSDIRRAKETAKLVARGLNISKTVFTNQLAEVKFNLKKLLSEKEYLEFGSDLVRKRFIEAFVNDKLDESRSSIKKRINNLFKKLDVMSDGRYILISHSFFMKILEVYLENKDLFEDPKILESKFNYQKKTFDFGSGFDFKIG